MSKFNIFNGDPMAKGHESQLVDGKILLVYHQGVNMYALLDTSDHKWYPFVGLASAVSILDRIIEGHTSIKRYGFGIDRNIDGWTPCSKEGIIIGLPIYRPK